MTLGEELLLLALDDEKGTVSGKVAVGLDYGLAGSLLIELLLSDKVLVREKTLCVIDHGPVGDELLDEALGSMVESDRDRITKHWIKRLKKKVKNLRERLANDLVAKDILQKERHRKFGFVPSTRYPTKDPAIKQGLIDRIRGAVVGGDAPEPQLAALISLVYACGISDQIFSRRERREAKRRMKEIASSRLIGQAVADVVKDVEAEILAAATAGAGGS